MLARLRLSEDRRETSPHPKHTTGAVHRELAVHVAIWIAPYARRSIRQTTYTRKVVCLGMQQETTSNVLMIIITFQKHSKVASQ